MKKQMLLASVVFSVGSMLGYSMSFNTVFMGEGRNVTLKGESKQNETFGDMLLRLAKAQENVESAVVQVFPDLTNQVISMPSEYDSVEHAVETGKVQAILSDIVYEDLPPKSAGKLQ